MSHRLLDLNTFGAILAYAIELETRSAAFHDSAAKIATSPALVAILESLRDGAARHVQIVERVRRENVTEMILTPIHELHSSAYAPDFTIPTGDAELQASAVAIERTKERYYSAVQEKTELAEAARALGRLERACRQHVGDVQAISLTK